jgi:hypothetical protein
MKTRLLLFSLSLLTGILLHAQNLSVIGNQNGVPAGMPLSQLKSVFAGNTKLWGNGTKVMLALMKSTTASGGLTCGKVYQLSCDEVTKLWLKKALGGNTAAPVFFNTVGELQAFVARTPGAIGIIDLSPPASGVHIVTIDGRNSF